MKAWEFEIVAIRQTNAPTSGHKDSWYRYTIANQLSEITGTRRGSRDEVMAFVKASLQRLNNRDKVTTYSKN